MSYLNPFGGVEVGSNYLAPFSGFVDVPVQSGSVDCIFSSYQLQRIVAGFDRSINISSQIKSVQSETISLERNTSSSVSESQVQSNLAETQRTLVSSTDTKQLNVTSSIHDRSIESTSVIKQVESATLSLLRSLDSQVVTKQVETTNGVFDLTLDTVFNSQTKQAQSSDSLYVRTVGVSGAIKQVQAQSNIVLGRTLATQIGISQAQVTVSSYSGTLDFVATVNQYQAQSSVSSYSRSIGSQVVVGQTQKFRFFQNERIITLARKYTILPEVINFVLDAEYRTTVVATEDRELIVSINGGQ